MPVIERGDKAPLILHAPKDRALRSLWELAELEFTARDGRDPVSQADWATVTARYHAIVTERRAELEGVIREVGTVPRREQPSPRPVAPWVRDESGVVRNDQGHIVRMPVPEPPAPLLRLMPVELKPGLVVRELHPLEVAHCREAMQAAKVYEDDPEVAARWVASNRSLATVVVWHGQPLAYEFYHVFGQGNLSAGLLLHLTRERPSWFWRECQRPLWELFLRLGYRHMRSYTRADRPDFVQALKNRWGCQEFGQQEGYVLLDYDIAASLERCIGWPARRTLGRGWVFSRNTVVVREAAADDLAALPAWIAQHWAGTNRGEGVQALLDTRVNLDQATVLLGEVQGQLVDARVIHPRDDTVGRLAALMRATQPPSEERRRLDEGVNRWAAAVGYDTLATFIPEAQFRAAPELHERVASAHWRLYRVHDTSGRPSEMWLDVREALAQ